MKVNKLYAFTIISRWPCRIIALLYHDLYLFDCSVSGHAIYTDFLSSIHNLIKSFNNFKFISHRYIAPLYCKQHCKRSIFNQDNPLDYLFRM